MTRRKAEPEAVPDTDVGAGQADSAITEHPSESVGGSTDTRRKDQRPTSGAGVGLGLSERARRGEAPPPGDETD
jgi:hypothetical protein